MPITKSEKNTLTDAFKKLLAKLGYREDALATAGFGDLVGLAAPSGDRILYASPTGTGKGLSATDPCSLDYALAAFQVDWDGKARIFCAPGTYTLQKLRYTFGKSVGPDSEPLNIVGSWVDSGLGTLTYSSISGLNITPTGSPSYTTDVYKGYRLRWVTGANAGQAYMVQSNSSSAFGISQGMAVSPSASDTFVLEQPAVTINLPTGSTHWIGAGRPSTSIQMVGTVIAVSHVLDIFTIVNLSLFPISSWVVSTASATFFQVVNADLIAGPSAQSVDIVSATEFTSCYFKKINIIVGNDALSPVVGTGAGLMSGSFIGEGVTSGGWSASNNSVMNLQAPYLNKIYISVQDSQLIIGFCGISGVLTNGDIGHSPLFGISGIRSDLAIYSVAIHDNGQAGIDAQACTVLLGGGGGNYLPTGTGNGTFGLKQYCGSRVYASNGTPTLTGTSGDVSLNGTTETWAAIVSAAATGITVGGDHVEALAL